MAAHNFGHPTAVSRGLGNSSSPDAGWPSQEPSLSDRNNFEFWAVFGDDAPVGSTAMVGTISMVRLRHPEPKR